MVEVIDKAKLHKPRSECKFASGNGSCPGEGCPYNWGLDLGDSVPSDKRLAITLRYLATGADITLLGDTFGIAGRTVRDIILQVCLAITNSDTLKSLINFPKHDVDFAGISRRFFDRFQFPNCVGAVDDTHIPITKPKKSEDPRSYFDYKHDYSIHL